MANQLPLGDVPGSGAANPGGNTSNVPEYSVSEISFKLKRVVENKFSHVRLRGEISGYRGPHSSGHAYFALKDEKARIEAVIWRGVFSRLKFKPEEGMEIIATGKITTYPGSSKYQIVIERLEPAGVGALMALLEERKKKFAAQGLFDEERKKKLPFLPGTIGIITSPTGAVIRDMLHGFNERFPAHVILWPVRVQGETSGKEVAAAIRGFNAFSVDKDNALRRPDVLIVARGGGSLEDLWGFNEEEVVRAVAASTIPIISAVGHETDWTLIDLVSDARAPTPTKAAEWAVPKFSELVDRGAELQRRLRQTVQRALNENRARLLSASRGLPKLIDIVALPRQRLDTASQRLAGSLRASCQLKRSQFNEVSARLSSHTLIARMAQARERLAGLTQRRNLAFSHTIAARREALNSREKLLKSLSYQSVLARGYSVVRDENAKMIKRAADIVADMTLELEFSDGTSPVISFTPGQKPASTSAINRPPYSGQKNKRRSAKPKAKKPDYDAGGQGSLF